MSGALIPLSLAPFDLWPLALVAAGLLLEALQDQPPRRAFLLGWLSGVGRYGIGVSWVWVSIHEHGNASPLLATVLVTLFVAGLALLPALMALGFAALRPRGTLVAAAAFAGCWVLLEWTLTWLLTGFPWLLLGYSQLATPLAGWAPVAGVLGVSLVVVLTGAALRAFGRGFRGAGRNREGVVALVAAGLIWGAGAGLQEVRWTRPMGEALEVALVQGAVPQREKWLASSRQRIIDRHLALSADHWGVDLLLWSEAALTVYPREAGPLLDRLDRHGERSGTTLITGIPDYSRDPDDPRRVALHNSARALGTGEGRYLKQRLVPFGEYVPLEGLLRGLIDFFDLPMSRARPGPEGQAPLTIGTVPAAMAICYEIAYPDLVRELADGTRILLTISNDAWFGDSIGPPQHLQIARMRALELGRPLARATNDGITALVDDRGRVLGRLPRFEPGVLAGTLQPTGGRTPFATAGSWPVVLLAVLLLLPALVGRIRRRS